MLPSDKQLRGKSRCGRCEHRVASDMTRCGHPLSICDLTGERAYYYTQGCRNYQRSRVDAKRDRADGQLYRLRHTSAAGQTPDLAMRIKAMRANLSTARRRGNPAIVEKWEQELARLVAERDHGHQPPATSVPPTTPAPRPTPTVCPRCGGQLRRDRDDIVCVRCWITIWYGPDAYSSSASMPYLPEKDVAALKRVK